MVDLMDDTLEPFGLDEVSDCDAEEIENPTVLTFTLGEQVFAVDVTFVQEILDLTTISPLPNAPHDVLGMIDLRGQGIAIADLASRIGAMVSQKNDARIIVFQFNKGDELTSLGVLADRVLNVREIGETDVEPVPDTLTGWTCDVAKGMVRTQDGIAMILDIDRILCGDARPGAFDFG